MRVSQRIISLCDLLDEDLCLADIGCDHGYLDILYASRTNSRIYACDIAEEPLKRAALNIEKAGLGNRIQLVLSDGLDQIVDENVNGLVIAGLGNDLVQSIIDRAEKRWPQWRNVVIQCRKNEEVVRRFMMNHQFMIADEVYLSDLNHDYVLMKFMPGSPDLRYNDYELLIGPVLAQKREDAYLEYCQRKLNALKKINSYQNRQREIKFLKEMIEGTHVEAKSTKII